MSYLQMLRTSEILSSGYITIGTRYRNSSIGDDYLRPFSVFDLTEVDNDMPMPSIEAEVDNDIVKIIEKKPDKRSLIF